MYFGCSRETREIRLARGRQDNVEIGEDRYDL
jgi:hypothetical protein